MATPTSVEARRHSPWLYRALEGLRYLNNILLIPMFTLIAIEVAQQGAGASISAPAADADLVISALFFAEWCLDLWLAPSRRAFLRSPARLLELVSSLPFGAIFRGARVVRLARVARMLRVVWRLGRLRGKAPKLLRALGLVAATTLAGALAFQAAEPETVPSFGMAVWWAIVTLSTVGYGEVVPTTPEGRVVAALLIFFGIGIFGYAAGFVASVLDDPEEDEILAAVRRIERKVDDLARNAGGAAGTDGERNAG
jgi:voltage-gated potassium channel